MGIPGPNDPDSAYPTESGGGGLGVALHYRASWTMATPPESGVWFLDIVGMNGEPTGTLTPEEWADSGWNSSQVTPPVCAKLAKGIYIGSIDSMNSGSPLPDTSADTFGRWFEPVAGAWDRPHVFNHNGPPLRFAATDGTKGFGSAIFICPEDDALYGFEIDVADGADFTTQNEIIIARVADLPAL